MDTVKISSGGLCGVVSTGTRLVKRSAETVFVSVSKEPWHLLDGVCLTLQWDQGSEVSRESNDNCDNHSWLVTCLLTVVSKEKKVKTPINVGGDRCHYYNMTVHTCRARTQAYPLSQYD